MAPVTKLFGEAEIARRVDGLAREIADAVGGGDFMVLGLLKGSFVLVADLIRALDRLGLAPEVEFIRLASYGPKRQSSGEARLIGELPEGLAGRRIVVIDDIVDTGRSMAHALELVRQAGAGHVWTCALLDKPSRREIDLEADFVGFVIDDVFVAGYGIDYAEDYRHLPYIGVID